MSLTALEWGALARAIHILSVVVWIGGVSMVTTVLLPGMRRKSTIEWIREFDAIERRFALQARVAVLLAGISGLYMLYRYDLWARFLSGEFWWMHLMIFTWVLFSLVLFMFEPLVFHRWVHRRGLTAPRSTLALMLWLHRALLILSLTTVFAAAVGSHGGF